MPKLPEEPIRGIGKLDDKYGKFSLSFTDFWFTIPSWFCILFSYNSNWLTRFFYFSAYSSFTILAIIPLKYDSMYHSIHCYVYNFILVLCSMCTQFEYCSYYSSCTVPHILWLIFTLNFYGSIYSLFTVIGARIPTMWVSTVQQRNG